MHRPAGNHASREGNNHRRVLHVLSAQSGAITTGAAPRQFPSLRQQGLQSHDHVDEKAGEGLDKMAQITIRQCNEHDLPAVAVLLGQLITHDTPSLDPDVLQSILDTMNRAPEIYHNLVATDDQVIIGFISVIFYKTLFHKGGTALINELVVEAAYRGRGVGRLLVQRAKEEALARVQSILDTSWASCYSSR